MIRRKDGAGMPLAAGVVLCLFPACFLKAPVRHSASSSLLASVRVELRGEREGAIKLGSTGGATVVLVTDDFVASASSRCQVSIAVDAVAGQQEVAAEDLLGLEHAVAPSSVAEVSVDTKSEAPPLPAGNRREFRVYSRRSRRYVQAIGDLEFLGEAIAVYVEVGTDASLVRDSWGDVDVAVSEWTGGSTPFGPLSDVDRDGKVLIFISSTVSRERPGGGETYVDGCNVNGRGGCGDRGEIIYVGEPKAIGLDALEPRARLRFLQRNVLHETVHLLVEGRSPAGVGAPTYIQEGLAEAPRYLKYGEGLGSHSQAMARVIITGRLPSPHDEPYVVGGLLVEALRRRFGNQVYASMIEAASVGRSPLVAVSTAATREVLARFWASLVLGELGISTGVDLPFPGQEVRDHWPGGHVGLPLLRDGQSMLVQLGPLQGVAFTAIGGPGAVLLLKQTACTNATALVFLFGDRADANASRE